MQIEGADTLRALRAATGGALDNIWLDSVPPEEWPGIRTKDGRVTHIKLEGSHKGPISLGEDGLPNDIARKP